MVNGLEEINWEKNPMVNISKDKIRKYTFKSKIQNDSAKLIITISSTDLFIIYNGLPKNIIQAQTRDVSKNGLDG